MATPEAVAEKRELAGINADYKEKFGFHDPETGYAYKAPKGLSREVVESISEYKDEPQWMRDFRLKALEHFDSRPTPTWGGNLGQIDFDDIHYFVRASEKNSRDWDEVPEDIKNTFDRLGIPEAERKFLSGVGAQYESEVVYHQVNEKLEEQGVIFTDMDTALREHEDLVREYWATVIPPNDNKLAALNSAVWSGGSFVYVPAGVKVEMPLQAYFRINTENMGQFERTLIIAEEGSDVHYIEGCTAPVYSTDSLHSAVVEIVAKPSSRVRYTTVQNWSQNVYNLVTKRAVAQEDATMEWVDCNLGSKLTMKYPSIYLLGERGPRRDPLDRLRRRRPAPGRRRQDHPRRAEDDLVLDLLQVDLQGRRPRHLPRPARDRRGRDRIALEGRLRRAAARRGLALGHLPDDPDRRERRRRRPRGDGLEDRRRADLLPPEPRARRGGGLEDDRQRVHRAGHQGAADGVRGRAQPADRAADGGLDWLRSSRPSRAGLRRGAVRAPLSRRSCRFPTRRRRGGSSPTSPGSRSTPTHRGRGERRDRRRATGAHGGLPLGVGAARRMWSCCASGSASLVPASDPFVARNEAGWRDGVLVHVPAGVSGRGADPGRGPARRGRRRGRLADAGRPRGGRRGRGLGALRARPATRPTPCSTRSSSSTSARRRRSATSAPRTSPSAPGSSPPSGPRSSATPASTGPRSGSARPAARSGWRPNWRRRLRGAGDRRLRRRRRASTSTSTRPRSTPPRTRSPTSPSAASSPPGRPRSGAG